MPFSVTLPFHGSSVLACFSSYLAAETASRQADLSNLIDTANRVLVLRQVFGAGVCRLNRRSTLEDGRQAGGTNIEFAELIVCHLDRVSRVAVALRQERSSLNAKIQHKCTTCISRALQC